MLTEAVARGDTDSIAAATRLIQRHPEAGIQAAIAAVPNCPAPTIRDDMIALIAAQKDPAVLPFLQSELKDSSSNARRYAAELLFRRGDTSGIPVACQDLIFAVAHPPPDSTRDDWPSPTRLSSFLLSSGDPAAVACALKVFPSLSDADRGDILQGGLAPIPKSGTVETAVDVQLDAFLVNCLDDNGFIDGCINHAVNPRNGDMAADDLIQRWHLSRPVPFNADFRTRLTLRTQLKNRWRREHDQPPLKLPAAPAIPTADPVHLKQLAAQLTAAQTPQAVQAVLADYDTLGLPGFAPLSAALAALPAGHPALAPGRVELSRLASILRSVEFADGSAPLPPALDAPLRKMIGRPLDAAALCDWLQDYCLAPARRLYVDLDRASDGSGVSLHLWLGPASAPTATLFSYSTTYFLAGKDIGGAGANCEARDTGTKNFFQSDCASLTQILTAAPTELGIARIDLVWKPE